MELSPVRARKERMQRQEVNADDAMQRLVRAMVGSDDERATSLARRVLGSQIGAASHDSDRKHIDLSSTWRRIARKATSDRSRRTEVERLYGKFERQCPDRELPPKVLAVLTKLMGKKIRTAAPFRQNTPLPPPNPIRRSNSAMNSTATSGVTRSMMEEQRIREEKKELESEESLLLRECLYSLQGIDGERIRYYHRDQDNGPPIDIDSYEGIRVQSPALTHSLMYSGRVLESRLGTGAIDALRICGEAGWLYNRIHTYIYEVQHDESKGVVARAFAGTLTEELREYHSLLTQYESKLDELTVRQLMVDLRMPTSRLKILAMLTDGLRDFSGGHLLSALHKHSIHGDTRHSSLVQSLLYSASRPWFDMLYLWTTQGILSDPHQEFFIAENLAGDDKNLWKEKYHINKDQIPLGILDPSLVGPALNVGKGINFIRRCLLDGKFTMHFQAGDSDEDTPETFNRELGYRYKACPDGNSTNVELEKTLELGSNLVHTHILTTLKEDNCMVKHLFALKQFLLLGQGDFFSALMEGLHKEYGNEPGVVGIYKHSLLSIVEGALRSTNAKYMPQFVLDRLEVELLLDPDDDVQHMFGPDDRLGTDDQRTVWDIFMLGYQVPDQLLAVVHQDSLDKYKMVFSLLFKLKKVEYMLNYTWRQSATLQHALHTSAQYNGINIGASRAYGQASFLLRKISILRQSMIHLIVNLKSYLMFEVLEGGWRRLEMDIGVATTLDEVIYSHDRYIDGIVRKSLVHTETSDASQQRLSQQVQSLLVIASDFCDLQEQLFQDSLLSADVAAEKRMEAESRLQQGRWGFDFQQDVTEEENFFGLADMEALREVVRMSEYYNENAIELLRILSEKVNGYQGDRQNEPTPPDEISQFSPILANVRSDLDDLDPQRSLIAQLDHNNFYGSQEE